MLLFAQLVDYDRFNNSLTKLRDKKEKTLNDEKNLFKVRVIVVVVIIFMSLPIITSNARDTHLARTRL
jgi:hypothetical protein